MKTLRRLEAARPALAALPPAHLARVWSAAIAELRAPPAFSPAAALRDQLAAALAFSPAALAAGLEVVLASVAGPEALALFEKPSAAAPGPLLVLLAATPPGLAAQAVLPALALRRPLLLKTASAEPHFAPLLLSLLAEREPILGEALAVTTWKGGDRANEDPLLAAAGRVIAYGGAEAMAALAPRCRSFFGFGPKISLAIVGRDAEKAAVAKGLARDIALLDQRGCLSVQLVLAEGDGRELAAALAAALEAEAELLPPGPAEAAALAELRLLREEAALHGRWVSPLPLRQGTVLLEDPGASLRPSPGGRLVRIYPLASLDQALPRLETWRGLLQGVALAGSAAEKLSENLRALGASRIAPPGQLQQASLASWPNGGQPVLEIFGA